jgi:23S rRNA (cytidine2498-2'-O)-methyltransferase
MEPRTGYLAPDGFEGALERELQEVVFRQGRLFVAEGAPQKVRWAQNIWYDLREISFHSISEAAAKLRSLQALWAYYPSASARRGALIEERLPFFAPKPFTFPAQVPKAPLGSWTLLNDQTILCAPRCLSPFAHGEIHFVETKEPPSRAYLKLWEFFTRLGKMPARGEKCLEIGASPGGWTWALHQLGASVTAVDRAPLASSVRCASFLKKDAFSLRAEDFPEVEWIFSDVICYPKKLLEWIRPWLVRPNLKFVCTLKFQGEEDFAILDECEKFGKIIRLHHNKHELTWFRLEPQVL